MTIRQLKYELQLSNKQIAEFFDLAPTSYQNSTAKKRYEKALCEFYKHLKEIQNERTETN